MESVCHLRACVGLLSHSCVTVFLQIATQLLLCLGNFFFKIVRFPVPANSCCTAPTAKERGSGSHTDASMTNCCWGKAIFCMARVYSLGFSTLNPAV